MKIKTIKKVDDLIAGPYIRAVINYRGDFWIEYQELTGRIYIENMKYLGRVCKISGKKKEGYYFPEDGWFMETLSGELVSPPRTHRCPFKTVLIPFSNKAWNYLKDLAAHGDLRDFAQATNGRRSTDQEYAAFLEDIRFCEEMVEYRADQRNGVKDEW